MSKCSNSYATSLKTGKIPSNICQPWKFFSPRLSYEFRNILHYCESLIHIFGEFFMLCRPHMEIFFSFIRMLSLTEHIKIKIIFISLTKIKCSFTGKLSVQEWAWLLPVIVEEWWSLFKMYLWFLIGIFCCLVNG